MNENEAIRKLYIFSSTGGSGQCTDDEHEQAKKMAIVALEKQIPKKLFGNKYNPVHIGDTVSGLCPVCLEKFVCITPKLYAEKGWGYCKQCGQKLDWSGIR